MSAFGGKADNTRGSKRGPHGRIVLIHTGSFNDHICRLLSAPAWHPASGRYPALTSRQVSCQDRLDTTFHFSGGIAVAAAPFFVRRFRDVAVACLRRCFCSAYAESSPNVSTSPQKSGWQRSTADCIRRLRRIRLGSHTRDACLDLGRTVASTRRLYFRLIHQLFHA